MSTKKLSRTVIEGGRVGSNKYDRRHSHAEQRAAERNFMSKVIKDPENYEEIAEEQLTPVYKEFRDKLGPMYSWLDAQVGRYWADVRSEIAAKFDTRTTAGRHITFDHLLASVVDTLSGWDDRGRIAENMSYSRGSRFHLYYVDASGILCINASPEKNWKWYRLSEEEFAAMAQWLNGRMIAEKGGVFYWVTNNDGLWSCKWSQKIENTPYGIREGKLGFNYFSKENGPYEEKILQPYIFSSPYYETVKRTGLHWKYIENPKGFKQRGELTADEAKHFKSFHPGAQAEILAYGNTRLVC